MRAWLLVLLIAALGAAAWFMERRTPAATPAAPAGGYGTASPAAREFAKLADDYLDQWARRHPSIAAGNGLHEHDGELEDLSAQAVAAEVVWLRDTRQRLAAIPRRDLPPDELVDHRILDGVVDGWLLELDGIRNHRRNPMIYASAIADGVHNLMTMESAPPQTRMHRVTSKLRGVPRLLEAAKANLSNPPRVLVERGITMFEGASAMLGNDLAQAFPGPMGETRNAMLVEARQARAAIDEFVSWLRTDLLPRANGVNALGAEYVAARYRAEELIDVPLKDLLAIGMRELAREQALFREQAQRVDATRDPLSVWREIRRDHPKPGELVAATRSAVAELEAFVRAKDLAGIPDGDSVVVEASRPFDIGLASMHASPPLEPVPVRSIYYVTDANAAWPTERQDAWLERFNRASLAITSAHEAMPGHFVHALYMRQTPGKLRRIWIGLNPFPQPSSGQDGWAHYAEQLVVEQGFHADDPRYAMAQLSESMTRICRLIAGIQTHTGGWTVDESARFFESQAFVPAEAARQEAVRVVYDPTNGGYFLGKRAMLTLREDVRAKEGSGFTLRAFHERVMRDGIAPWWAHRYLMLGDSVGLVVQ
ncbi:MAG: DUF885 domain-containing protein [Gemmatimonadaceae bacterium]|nr:DUF885 domain-containing protein [Gemmatimonadaceae bacterium]